MTDVKLRDILPALKAWFPPNAHQKRKLPGGGEWFFIPWQIIRDRLDEVYPEWEDSYSDPIECGDVQAERIKGVIVVRCKLTIAGVTREGVGNSENDPYLDASERNGKLIEEKKYKGYGTPIDRATADAFKNAAERFGVGAYLDEQKDNRQKFIKYMQKSGDGRAYKAAYDNGWVETEDGEPAKPAPRPRESPTGMLDALSGSTGASPKVISEGQVKRFHAIASQHKWSNEDRVSLLSIHGYDSATKIQPKDYAAICKAFESDPTIGIDLFKALDNKAKDSGFSNKGLLALMFEFGYKTGGEIKVRHYQRLLSKASTPNLAAIYNSRELAGVSR